MVKKRILAIGKRETILKQLSQELNRSGYESDYMVNSNSDLNKLDAFKYDLVAFGRGVETKNKEQLKTRLSQQNPQILFMEGLAPIVPVLIDQIKNILFAQSGQENLLKDLQYDTENELNIKIEVTDDCRLEIILNQLDFLFRNQHQCIVHKNVEQGIHQFSTGKRLQSFGRCFLVIKINHEVVHVIQIL